MSLADQGNRYGISAKTVAKWRMRTSVKDAPMGLASYRMSKNEPEVRAKSPCRADVDTSMISAYADGLSGVALLHAALLEPRIRQIAVEGTLVSTGRCSTRYFTTMLWRRSYLESLDIMTLTI